MQVTTIGLDIAKNVFQVHGIDAAEKVVVRKQLRRSQVLEFFEALPPCLIGMEACVACPLLTLILLEICAVHESLHGPFRRSPPRTILVAIGGIADMPRTSSIC